jgi:photosystem II stability/assembly factor-like uncharacterized protein
MKTTSNFVTLTALALTALTANSSFTQCPDPIEYCSTSPNSVGTGAVMSWTGTPSIAADDFHLVMTGAPVNQFMVFYYGAAQISLPFGNGLRCVGAGGVGVFRFPVLQIDSNGSVDMLVDYNQPPAGGNHHDPGVWGAGDTWHCQGWYRDPAGGGSNFNLSNALEVQVCAGDTNLLFSEDFDDSTAPAFPAGWTTGANSPPDAGSTAWELGTPSSVGPSAANSPANCIGTNIDADYGADTDVWVRTPAIDLTNNSEATLSFNEFKDIEVSGADLDFGTIRVLAALDLAELAVLEAEVDGASVGWESYAIALPNAAFNEPIVIEFRLQTDATDLVGVENGSFEIPVMTDGDWNTSGGPGWSVTSGSGGIWNPDTSTGFPGGAPDGQNIGWANGGTLSQSLLGATLNANTQYVLSAQVGNPSFNGGGSGDSYRIELLAGGVLLDVQTGNAPAAGQWQAHSLTYDSGSNPAQLGQPLEIRLRATGSDEIDFDAVTLTGITGTGVGYAGWYIDDVEIRQHPEGGWQVLPNSPLAPYYHHDDLFFIDENIGWVCNISGEIWKTTDGGDSWTRVLNLPGTSFRTLTFADAMTGWVGNIGIGGWPGGITDSNVLYSTTDGGITWTPVTNISGPMPDGICGLQWIAPNTIHGAGRYAGDAYFISSTDGGASWISQDLNANYGAFVDVLFFTPDDGYITAHVNAPGGQDAAQLLHTTDGGASWTTVMSSNAYHYWKIGVASDTFRYGVCWSGQDDDKWIQSYDGGQTWTQEQFVGGYEANGIGFLDEQTGFIGGHEVNTYQTFDGGANWTSIQIDTVYGDYINKFLRVSDTVIYGIGMRIYKYSAEQSSAYSGPQPPVFDNSPCTLTTHPSDGNIAITYTVPKEDHVEITIYERGGIIHDRIVDERQKAGTYTIEYVPHNDIPVLYASIVTGLYRQRAQFINHP